MFNSTMCPGGEIMRVGVSVKRWYREDQSKGWKDNYHIIESSTHLGKLKGQRRGRNQDENMIGAVWMC